MKCMRNSSREISSSEGPNSCHKDFLVLAQTEKSTGRNVLTAVLLLAVGHETRDISIRSGSIRSKTSFIPLTHPAQTASALELTVLHTVGEENKDINSCKEKKEREST